MDILNSVKEIEKKNAFENKIDTSQGVAYCGAFFCFKKFAFQPYIFAQNRFFKWKAIKNCKKLVKFLGKRKLLPGFAGYLLRVKKLFRVNC